MDYEYEAEVALLAAKCRELFGDESTWKVVSGYRSLALCVIDSIYSTGSHYNSVINVVARYKDYRSRQGADAYNDGIQQLLESFNELGGSDVWADTMDNRKPASTKPGASLKAEVIYQAAVTLKKHGIQSAVELNEQVSTTGGLEELKSVWRQLPSQSSGITFNYLMILAGYQSVKPDRMVLRFIDEHTNLKAWEMGSEKVTEFISRTAAAYKTEARKLDHVIWRYASGRPIRSEESLRQ